MRCRRAAAPPFQFESSVIQLTLKELDKAGVGVIVCDCETRSLIPFSHQHNHLLKDIMRMSEDPGPS